MSTSSLLRLDVNFHIRSSILSLLYLFCPNIFIPNVDFFFKKKITIFSIGITLPKMKQKFYEDRLKEIEATIDGIHYTGIAY